MLRDTDGRLTTANFWRAQLYAVLATLASGMALLEDEQVTIDRLMAHGGFFKTPTVGQRYLAAACNTPVTCLSTAGEGGPYGMALLAAYAARHDSRNLEQFLAEEAFADAVGVTLTPDEADREGFLRYLQRFSAGLAVQRAATAHL